MKHIGRETTVTVSQQTYTLSRFTRKLLAEFIDWSLEILPHPLDMVKLDGIPEKLGNIIVAEAIAATRLRHSVSSPHIQRLMNSMDGIMKILSLLLRKHHSSLASLDFARYLYGQSAADHGERYLLQKIITTHGEYVLPSEDEGRPNGKPPEPENWEVIDTILMKQYHLRPWELDELTLPECSFMLHALREEEKPLTMTAGMDQGMMQVVKAQMDARIQKQLDYAKLSPQAKLDLAYKQYR